MTKDRRNTLAVINFALLIVGLILVVELLPRGVSRQTRTVEEYRARVEQITNVEALRRLLVADDEYIRHLEGTVALARWGLLATGVVVSSFALWNLLLIPWRAREHEP